MKKILISVLMVLMAAVLAAGCASKAETLVTNKATAYDMVHGHYLGIVDMTVNNDGDVLDVNFDEILFPYSWAKVNPKAETATVVPTNATFTDMWKNETVTTAYAKYIKIGDKIFEATGTIVDNKSVPVWAEVGGGEITDLEAALADDTDLQKWYYEEGMKVSSFRIVKKVGEAYENEKYGTNNSNGGLFKSTNNYWRAVDGKISGMGWEANMFAMSNYLKTNGVNYTEGDLADIEKDAGTGTYKLGDVNTGATLTDFADYMTVAKAAYDKAVDAFDKD